jgi:hypothetical protein
MANGKDSLAYLTDILGRIGSHPAARLDDLLPQNWSPRTQQFSHRRPASSRGGEDDHLLHPRLQLDSMLELMAAANARKVSPRQPLARGGPWHHVLSRTSPP